MKEEDFVAESDDDDDTDRTHSNALESTACSTFTSGTMKTKEILQSERTVMKKKLDGNPLPPTHSLIPCETHADTDCSVQEFPEVNNDSGVLDVRSLVMVDSRTWPGINKPGGPGRVTAVRQEEDESLVYDIRYIFGGFEKGVKREFIHLSNLLERNHPARVSQPRQYYHEEFAEPRAVNRAKQEQTKKKRWELLERSAEDENLPMIEESDMQGVGAILETEKDIQDVQRPHRDKSDRPRKRRRLRQQRDRIRRDFVSEAGDFHPVIYDSSNEKTSEACIETESEIGHSRRQVTQKKRRRYVGGYWHHGEDADSTFIQPEDSAMDLPDDIRKQTHFKLADSVDGLMHQLAVESSRFEMALSDFYSVKCSIDLDSDSTLSHEELNNLYHRLTQLEWNLKEDIIRSGEDIVDMIIREIERRNALLPENLELEHDERKRRVADYGTWLRKTRSIVEGIYCDTRWTKPGLLQDMESDNEDDRAVSNEMSWEENGAEESEYDRMDDAWRDGRDTADLDRHDFYTSGERIMTRKSQRAYTRSPRNRSRTHSDIELDLQTQSPDRKTDSVSLPLLRQSKVRLTTRMITIEDFSNKWNWHQVLKNVDMRRRISLPSRSSTKKLSKKPRNAKSWSFSHDVNAKVRALRNRRFKKHSEARPQIFGQNNVSPPTDAFGFQNSHHNDIESQNANGCIDWDSVFGVVQSDSSLSHLLQLAPCTIQKQQLLLNAAPPFNEEQCTQLPSIHDSADHQKAFIVHQGQLTRQSLNMLHWKEIKFMETVTSELLNKEDISATVDWKNTTIYKELIVLEEACDQALVNFTEAILKILSCEKNETSLKVTDFSLAELKQLLQCVPCCGQIFEDFRGYYAFFELGNEKLTPLFHAICRIFWHALRIASTLLKMPAFETRQSESGSILAPEMPDILRPKRVILAAALYLIDLYLYVPTSHRSAQEDEPNATLHNSGVSTQALWLYIFRCSQDQLGNRQSAEASSDLLLDSKNFWTMLQLMFEHDFVRQLAFDFVARRPFGSYTHDKKPERHEIANSELSVGAEVLALKVGWELTVNLACLSFDNKTPKSSTQNDVEKWEVVKVLIRHSGGLANGTPTCKMDELFNRNFEIYKNMALQHILILSGLWSPCIEVVELVCFEMNVRFNPAANELPSILAVLEEKNEDFRLVKRNNPSELAQLIARWSLNAMADNCHSESQAYIDLICSIALAQLSKFEKSIQRNRSRQRLIRTISSRIEANTCSGVHVKTEYKWDWKEPVPCNSTMQPANQLINDLEPSILLCFLALFAFISIQFDASETFTLSAQSSREYRQLLRDIEYYCKEMIKCASGKSAQAPLLARLFTFIGRLVIGKPDLLLILFTQFSAHLEEYMKELLQTTRITATVQTTTSDQQLAKRKNPSAFDDLMLMEFTNLAQRFLDHINDGNLARSNARPSENDVLSSCVITIISSGLALSIDACIEKLLSQDHLQRILHLLWQLSSARFYKPILSLKSISVTHSEAKMGMAEVVNDDFGDDDMLELLANVDLERLSSVKHEERSKWTTRELSVAFEADILKALTRHYRLTLQRLLFSNNIVATRSCRESSLLYKTMQLFGYIVSTCSSSFSWDVARAASLQKSFYFTSELFSAIIRHNWDARSWLVLSFFSDTKAEIELLQLWLKATFDPITLFQNRDSPEINYWKAMTDAIIYHVLQNGTFATKMTPLMLQCMQKMVTEFHPMFISQLTTTSVQLDHCELHFQLFLSLCKSIESAWNSSCLERCNQRYQFRSKWMDRYHGVFANFAELYEVNLRHMITQLEQMKNSGWMRSTLVLQQKFARQQYASTNAHSLDASIDSLNVHSLDRKVESNAALWQTLRLYKFMYDCIEAFLKHCSDLAIGQQNTFFAMMEVMFRQAVFAENERIKTKFPSKSPSSSTAKSQHSLTAWNPLLESIRTYFAQQKYPSLMYWFARTQNSYQTFENGWNSSNLRLLFLNTLDCDGALGIRSYYPDLVNEQLVNVATRVRREAYYLSCGLLVCNAQTARIRSISNSSEENSHLLTEKLRHFILTKFLTELLSDALSDSGSLGQTLLPCAQFVKAYIHHCKLNLELTDSESVLTANPLEALPFTSLLAGYIFCKPPEGIMQYVTLSYILAIELCGMLQYMLETFKWWSGCDQPYDHGQVYNLLQFSLCSLGVILRHVSEASFNEIVETLIDAGDKEKVDFDAIKNGFLKENTRLLVDEFSLIQRVDAFDKPRDSLDTYGFSEALVCADLLCATRSLVKVCCLAAAQSSAIQAAVQSFANLRC